MHWRLGSWRLFHFRSHCTNAQRAVSALRKLICGLIQQKCPYIQNQIICIFLDLKWFHTQVIKQPFKPKIRKVWIIPTRPWMWNKKRGLQKSLTLFDKKHLQLVWTQSFWLEITGRRGEHLETIIIITNITFTVIVIIFTAYKSYNGRVGSPLHQSHWFNPRGWKRSEYTCFARSALCTGNLYDLYALVISITRPKPAKRSLFITHRGPNWSIWENYHFSPLVCESEDKTCKTDRHTQKGAHFCKSDIFPLHTDRQISSSITLIPPSTSSTLSSGWVNSLRINRNRAWGPLHKHCTTHSIGAHGAAGPHCTGAAPRVNRVRS